MTNTLAILAAGKSSRMKNSHAAQLSKAKAAAANTLSKGLLEINGVPFLHYLLKNAAYAGFTNVVLIVGENDEHFRAIYGVPNAFGLNISFAVQKIPAGRQKPLGTADALLQMLDQFPHLKSESFCSCNSDNLYSAEALRELRENNSGNAMIGYRSDGLAFSEERIRSFAILEHSDLRLTGITEKPKSGTLFAADALVSMNLFKFSGAEIYPQLAGCTLSPRGEKEIPTALLGLIRTGNTVHILPRSEHVPDLTTKSDIAIVECALKEQTFNF